MSTDRQHGRIIFVCDACGETQEAADDDFDSFWQGLKKQGWQARKEDDEWQHLCPECAA
jgi:Fe2+ or Zn2+ uptake regulation protein